MIRGWASVDHYGPERLQGFTMLNRKIILSCCALAGGATHTGMGQAGDPEPGNATHNGALFRDLFQQHRLFQSAALAAARGLKRSDVLYAPALNVNLADADGWPVPLSIGPGGI